MVVGCWPARQLRDVQVVIKSGVRDTWAEPAAWTQMQSGFRGNRAALAMPLGNNDENMTRQDQLGL